MITSINHIGIGVYQAKTTFAFYRDLLGFSIKMNDFKTPVLEPTQKTESDMQVINCGCPYGGGFLEIFQYLDRAPQPPENEMQWSNTGFLEAGIEVVGLSEIYRQLQQKKVSTLTGVCQFSPDLSNVWETLFLKSPDGFPLRLIDKHPGAKVKKPVFCGIHHVTIGVKDLEQSVRFYREVMGFDRIVFRGKVGRETLTPVMPSPGDGEMAMLESSHGSTSKISSYTGGIIVLLQVDAPEKKNVYQNRRFGDPGISELGFDVIDIRTTYMDLVKKGAKPLVDPFGFNWFPGPEGALAYLTDNEGNILELIETTKMYGLSIDTVDKICIRPMLKFARKGLSF